MRRFFKANVAFRQVVFWVRIAPQITSQRVRAGHHPCRSEAFQKCRVEAAENFTRRHLALFTRQAHIIRNYTCLPAKSRQALLDQLLINIAGVVISFEGIGKFRFRGFCFLLSPALVDGSKAPLRAVA